MIIGAKILRYMMKCRRPGYSQWGHMCFVRWGVVLVRLLELGNIVMSQYTEPGWDPVTTVCNIVHASSTIVGERLYVDGGELIDQGEYKYGPENPYHWRGLVRWESKSPPISLLHDSIDCLLSIARSTPLGTRPFKQVQCLSTPMEGTS